MSLTAEDVVRLFEEDERALSTAFIIASLTPGSEIRSSASLLLDVATKSDLERLRGEVKALEDSLREDVRRLEAGLSGLEARISGLERRAARVEGQLSLFVKLFAAFNLPTLLGVVGILLKMALAP